MIWGREGPPRATSREASSSSLLYSVDPALTTVMGPKKTPVSCSKSSAPTVSYHYPHITEEHQSQSVVCP